jgi:hypothetical protein
MHVLRQEILLEAGASKNGIASALEKCPDGVCRDMEENLEILSKTGPTDYIA